MIYMYIFMFVRVLYPKNLLHFAMAITVWRVVYGLRDAEVAVLGLHWLVHEMKVGYNAFYDAEINAKLVAQARFRIEGHPFWNYNTRYAILSYFTSLPLQ